MWFGFQFNLSDSSDDGLYRLDLDPEGQGHQWKMISIQLGSYFGAPKKKLSRGCLRVRPDANANADADADADANRSKTICRPLLKGVDIKSTETRLVRFVNKTACVYSWEYQIFYIFSLQIISTINSL